MLKKTLNHFVNFFGSTQAEYNVILVNTIINHSVLDLLLPCSKTLICCDGGTNQLYNFSPDIPPDVIIGDLDSIDEEILSYYLNNDCISIIKDDNQEVNDLEKSFMYLLDNDDLHNTLFYGNNHGRTDHCLHFYHLMYKYKEYNPVCISDTNVVRILDDKYKHRIYLNEEYERNDGIGIIPLGECGRVRTDGLKWDVDDCLVFGGELISTSNEIDGDVIEIETDSPMLFISQLNIDYSL